MYTEGAPSSRTFAVTSYASDIYRALFSSLYFFALKHLLCAHIGRYVFFCLPSCLTVFKTVLDTSVTKKFQKPSQRLSTLPTLSQSL